MPIVVLLFCRSHCPRRRRCLKLPNEQPECRHIELFPLKEHLSSLDQCKVFFVETLQDTHLLIHGSSSWTSFWFTPCRRMSLQVREVPTTDCWRCQSVQIEVKNYNQLEAKSLHLNLREKPTFKVSAHLICSMQLRHLDSFIIAHITPDNIKL